MVGYEAEVQRQGGRRWNTEDRIQGIGDKVEGIQTSKIKEQKSKFRKGKSRVQKSGNNQKNGFLEEILGIGVVGATDKTNIIRLLHF